MKELLIAGGGLGGLAAALAAGRAGWQAGVYEQAEMFSQFGAGIQLGPNVTRILRDWGLLAPLAGQLAFPGRLAVRDAAGGEVLAVLPLGQAFEARYGAPYATVHRADLHAALFAAAQAGGAGLRLGRRVVQCESGAHAVLAHTSDGATVSGDALVGADGLWSSTRAGLLEDGGPRPSGHLAYRGLVAQKDLPAGLRSAEVTVWLGPRLHLVSYPVRGGEWLNVVCVVQGTVAGDARGWDHAGAGAELLAALGPACAAVRELVQALPGWRLWVLHDRPPVAGPDQMARGRVALLGDAAHPMRPYLAQGAGMAIEDAAELGRVLAEAAGGGEDVPAALRRYALNRWARCARVQRRSQRNGTVFHATGALRWGRNLALRTLGERLLDQPWLYR